MFWKSEQELQRAHLERLKALEMGHPLPSVEAAWAEADKMRSTSAIVRVFFATVTIGAGLVGAPAALTALFLDSARNQFFASTLMQCALGVFWCVSGVVSFKAAAKIMGVGEPGQARGGPVRPTGQAAGSVRSTPVNALPAIHNDKVFSDPNRDSHES
jgi:hypothetical protein